VVLGDGYEQLKRVGRAGAVAVQRLTGALHPDPLLGELADLDAARPGTPLSLG
jgi:hypothetical protein